MKIAVMADIHGNAVALDTCRQHALEQGITKFFFLGDYLGECGNPAKTMSILYEMQEKYECHFVRGNKEDAWLGIVKDEGSWLEYGNSTTGTLLYLYEHRTQREQKFFEALEVAKKISVEEYPDILLCHGSPVHNKQCMYADDMKTLKIIEECDSDIILYGHTHRRRVIEHKGKIAYNPGAVGAPLESGGKSQYMILHGDRGTWNAEYVDLEYDVEQAIKHILEEKLHLYAPNWCKITQKLLRTGEVSHGKVLQRAMELCKEETGECNWPDIPDLYWEKGLKEFGIS